MGLVAVLIAASSSAATPTVAKIALMAGGQPLELAAGRAAVAAACLWISAGIRGQGRVSGRRAAPVLLTATLLFSGQSGLLLAALGRLPAATVTLLVYSYPALVAGLSLVLGRERLNPARSLALALSSAGVALVAATPAEGITVAGAAAALGSALLFACYVVSMGAVPPGMSLIAVGAVVTSGAALTLGTVAIATSEPPLEGSIEVGVLVLALGGLQAASTAAYLAAIARIGPTRTAITDTLQPVIAVLLATSVLGERLGPRQIGGGLAVLVGLAGWRGAIACQVRSPASSSGQLAGPPRRDEHPERGAGDHTARSRPVGWPPSMPSSSIEPTTASASG